MYALYVSSCADCFSLCSQVDDDQSSMFKTFFCNIFTIYDIYMSSN